MSILVQHILSAKGAAVHTVPSGATLGDAASILADRDIGALVCTDSGGGIVGIVSERDITRAMAAHGAKAVEVPVSQVMSRDVVACGVNDEMSYLLTLMTEARCRHLPVISNGQLAGMISIGDVVRAVNR